MVVVSGGGYIVACGGGIYYIYIYVRVASRNRTLAHIPRFEKMADEVRRTKIVFIPLPEGYRESFLAANVGIFVITSIAAKKNESKCLFLPILAGSRMRLFD